MTTNSDSWIRALGPRQPFELRCSCGGGDPCLLTVSSWDPGVCGLPTPGEDRQAAATACRSSHQYHLCVIRGAAADVAQRVPIDPGSLLALTFGASATVGGLCHAAERQVRWAASRSQRDMSMARCVDCESQWDALLSPLCSRCEQQRLLAAPNLIAEAVSSSTPPQVEAGSTTRSMPRGATLRLSLLGASLAPGSTQAMRCPTMRSTAFCLPMCSLTPMHTLSTRCEFASKFVAASLFRYRGVPETATTCAFRGKPPA
jgi:hypothetical protein